MLHIASRTLSLSASAIGVALLVSACGGGDAGAPPDLVPPTVTITDSVAAATATGPVTFTFTFSEDVGDSFTAEDVVVTGGTAGAFDRISGTLATLLVTPTADTAGTITVSVAADKFFDLSLNANEVAASASQAFNTVVVAPPPPVGGGTLLASFDEATPPAVTEFGGAGYAIEPGPAGGDGNALKITRDGGEVWAGAWVAIAAIPNDAGTQTISARVYSPTAGIPIVAKAEFGDNQGTGDVQANEAVVVGWQTLTWTFTNLAAPNVYNRFTILPNLNTVDTAKDYYFDDITLEAASTGGTGCDLPDCISFSGTEIGFAPFENGGGGTVGIDVDPVDPTNDVAKFVKKAGDGDYFGTVITGLGANVVLTPTAKTVTMRVFSPAVGKNILLKFEGGTGGPAATEIDVLTTKANEWETLSFVLPDAGTYSTIVIFPNARSQVSTDTVFYIDDITFPATQTTGGGGSGAFAGIFADNYVGELFLNATTAQGGDVGFFFDQRLVDTKAYDYAGLSGFAQNPGGVPNFYFGFGLNPPAITDAFFGAFVKAPGNGAVDVSGFTNLKLTVWGPDQLFQAGEFPMLTVVMQGPAVAGCGSNSGGSEVETTFATTTQGAASVYTLPLANFSLKFACSGETTPAQVLASIAQMNVLLQGTNIQYVNKDPDGVAFTNGLNIGPIKFD